MTSRHHPPPSSASSSPPPPDPPSPPQTSSFTSSISSRTNNNRQHIRDQTEFSQSDPTKKPFTSSSYRSRFSNTNSGPNSPSSIPPGYSAPKKRKSIFIEQLDSDPIQPDATAASLSIARKKQGKRSPTTSPSSQILSINPLGQKDSYMMHLPLQPLRISILLLILVAFTTISLSTSIESDLDSLLLKRVPGEDAVVERREASIAPSFRIGPAVRNPEKDIPKLRTGLLVLVVSLVFAGLMT